MSAAAVGGDIAVPLVDLGRQYAEIRGEAQLTFDRLAASGELTLGAELEAFEAEWADYCGTTGAVGVGSGTEALQLALLALGAEPGTEVVTVPHTFIATIEAIVATGAGVAFADVDPDSACLDPAALAAALTPRTVAVVPVHLYGRPAAMEQIGKICARAGVSVLEDAAQAHGARLGSRRTGALGRAAGFSFYPTKNLGAFGDGGAVTSRDEALLAEVRSLRHHGSAPGDANRHLRDGFTSRLDNLQAALLRLKLRRLDAWNDERRRLAARYRERLEGMPVRPLPAPPSGCDHVHHLFVVEADERDRVLAALRASGIGAAVHYPTPVHLQPAWSERGHREGEFPVAERLSRRVLSLPLFPGMTDAEQDRVVTALAGAVGG